MTKTFQIDLLDSTELQPYRTLRRAAEHVKQGIFVAEGEKVVRRLLETEIQVVSLLLTERWLEDLKPILQSKSDEDIRIWVAPKELLESIVGFDLHQGIMAIGRIPRPMSLEEIPIALGSPHLLVALDGLTNADNVGVIVRNCAAFGVEALIVPTNSSSPYLRRAVRMSMGTVFRLPIVSVENLAGSLQCLSSRYQIHAIAAQPGASTSIGDVDLSGKICIVLGSEGNGISPEVLEICSKHISIPLTNGTDSLNVATASAIFLFEAQRQRKERTGLDDSKGKRWKLDDKRFNQKES